jgi:hypothetical protein
MLKGAPMGDVRKLIEAAEALAKARERIAALEMPDTASELANQRAPAIIDAIREGHEQR